MTTIFFGRSIISPIDALRAPANPVGIRAQVWHFTKAEVLTRVIAAFASFVAVAETIAQLIIRQCPSCAARFFKTNWSSSFVGIWNPGALSLLQPQPPVAFAAAPAVVPPPVVPVNNNVPPAQPVPAAPVVVLQPAAAAAPLPEIHRLRNRENLTIHELETYLQANKGYINAINPHSRTVLNLELRANNPRADVIKVLLDHGATYSAADFCVHTMETIWLDAVQRGTVFKAFLAHPRTHALAFEFLRRDVASADRTALGILIDDYDQRVIPVQTEIVHLFSQASGTGGGCNNIPAVLVSGYCVDGLTYEEEATARAKLNSSRAAEGMPAK